MPGIAARRSLWWRSVAVFASVTTAVALVWFVEPRPAAADHGSCPYEFLATDLAQTNPELVDALNVLTTGGADAMLAVSGAIGGALSGFDEVFGLLDVLGDLASLMGAFNVFTDGVAAFSEGVAEFTEPVLAFVGALGIELPPFPEIADVAILGLDVADGLAGQLAAFQSEFAGHMAALPTAVAGTSTALGLFVDGAGDGLTGPLPLSEFLKSFLGLAAIITEALSDSTPSLLTPLRAPAEALSAVVKVAQWAVETLDNLRSYCLGSVQLEEVESNLRASIEANLASNGPAVSEFLWPAPTGRLASEDEHMVTVERVVDDTIAQLEIANYTISPAVGAYRAQAERELTNGEFLRAFRYFRLAYQAAVALR